MLISSPRTRPARSTSSSIATVNSSAVEAAERLTRCRICDQRKQRLQVIS